MPKKERSVIALKHFRKIRGMIASPKKKQKKPRACKQAGVRMGVGESPGGDNQT
tara:strand:- start:111975 stop:112136 length:162 start_codon:yes stop_codon:yes gene_type:complete